MKQVTVFALVALAALAVAAPQGKTDNLVTKSNSKQCEGTECPAGCCPEVGWFCCPDNLYCAATAADCPAKKTISKAIKLAANNTPHRCYGTGEPCPGNMFCCPDERCYLLFCP